MNLRSVPGLDHRYFAEVQPMLEKDDPQGPEYGRPWTPEGEPLEAFVHKLGSAEAFREGKADQDESFRFWVDLNEDITEFFAIQYPLDSGHNYKVSNVLHFYPEGITEIDAERTS